MTQDLTRIAKDESETAAKHRNVAGTLFTLRDAAEELIERHGGNVSCRRNGDGVHLTVFLYPSRISAVRWSRLDDSDWDEVKMADPHNKSGENPDGDVVVVLTKRVLYDDNN